MYFQSTYFTLTNNSKPRCLLSPSPITNSCFSSSLIYFLTLLFQLHSNYPASRATFFSFSVTPTHVLSFSFIQLRYTFLHYNYCLSTSPGLVFQHLLLQFFSFHLDRQNFKGSKPKYPSIPFLHSNSSILLKKMV